MNHSHSSMNLADQFANMMVVTKPGDDLRDAGLDCFEPFIVFQSTTDFSIVHQDNPDNPITIPLPEESAVSVFTDGSFVLALGIPTPELHCFDSVDELVEKVVATVNLHH